MKISAWMLALSLVLMSCGAVAYVHTQFAKASDVDIMKEDVSAIKTILCVIVLRSEDKELKSICLK